MSKQKTKSKPEGVDKQQRKAVLESTALLAELRNILAQYADKENWSESTVPVQGKYISNGHTEDHYTECYVDGKFAPAERGLEIVTLLFANDQDDPHPPESEL
jgi:hypothetical protein